MKATEFVKQYGLDAVNKMLRDFPKMTHVSDDARAFLNDIEYKKHAPWFADSVAKMVSFSDLKRIVESHELVVSLGGAEKCKGYVQVCFYKGYTSYGSRLNQAISDVEACQ